MTSASAGWCSSSSGYLSTSQIWTESLFRERGVKAILRAHVERVEPGKIYYETLDGAQDVLAFDFAMLLPPFRGADLKAYDRAGHGHHHRPVRAQRLPEGRRRLHRRSPYEQWRAADWPQTYQSPRYPNVFGDRHRVRPAARHLRPAHQPQRHRDRPRSAAHRDAVRR